MPVIIALVLLGMVGGGALFATAMTPNELDEHLNEIRYTVQCPQDTMYVPPMENPHGTLAWQNLSSEQKLTGDLPAAVKLRAGVEYQVQFAGVYDSLNGGTPRQEQSRECVISIDVWRSTATDVNADGAFRDMVNLTSIPEVGVMRDGLISSGVSMFEGAVSFNQDLSWWDAEGIDLTDFDKGATLFEDANKPQR